MDLVFVLSNSSVFNKLEIDSLVTLGAVDKSLRRLVSSNIVLIIINDNMYIFEDEKINEELWKPLYVKYHNECPFNNKITLQQTNKMKERNWSSKCIQQGIE